MIVIVLEASRSSESAITFPLSKMKPQLEIARGS